MTSVLSIVANLEIFVVIQAERKNCLEFDGGDSGIRTPDLRIMMKIASISRNKINGLQSQKPTV
jgi:hypothetical protein